MENNNIQKPESTNRMWMGLIVLVIGVIFLLRNFGMSIPDWLISWNTILLFIGLFIGFKRDFTGGGWLVMVLIGGYFTIADMADLDVGKYFFAGIFIILGLYLILKPKVGLKRKKKEEFAAYEQLPSAEDFVADQSRSQDFDFIDSVNVFGGANQKVYSKNFKGGDIVAVFGGCEVNLSQADFQDAIVIEVVAIFGGVKIIIPPTWEVKSEVVAIFGGMDDKRAVAPFGDGPKKLVIIKGIALFGGVNIRNF